jgi:general stress protein 26
VKKTTAEHDPQAAQKLRDLIHEIAVAMITTVRPDGALRSRPMFTQEVRDEGELWFFLSDDSDKAHDLAEEQAVNVSYADPTGSRFVSVSGNASIVHDSERVHELWKPELERFFPGGLDDPHLALMCVRIETAEYWDATSGAMVSVSDLPGTNRAAHAAPAGEHTRVDIRRAQTSG